MTIEILHSGIRIASIIGTQYISRLYIGYSVKRAVAAFNNEFNYKVKK